MLVRSISRYKYFNGSLCFRLVRGLKRFRHSEYNILLSINHNRIQKKMLMNPIEYFAYIILYSKFLQIRKILVQTWPLLYFIVVFTILYEVRLCEKSFDMLLFSIYISPLALRKVAKKSYYLNGSSIKASPPPPELNGCRIFFLS